MLRNGWDLTKKEPTKLVGRNDLILILIIIILAAGSLLALKFTQKTGGRIVVTIDSELYGSYDLKDDEEILIKGEDFESTLVISDGKANMVKADCRDQICVNHKPISHNGETIVCLPHKVVVSVEDKEESSKDKLDIITN